MPHFGQLIEHPHPSASPHTQSTFLRQYGARPSVILSAMLFAPVADSHMAFNDASRPVALKYSTLPYPYFVLIPPIYLSGHLGNSRKNVAIICEN
jgi:hypothetical protein